MSKSTIKGERGTIKIDNSFDDAVLKLLQNAIPEAYQEFTKVLKEIEADAKNNWIVRQPSKPVRDGEGNIKLTKEGKPRFRKQPASKGSIDKFRIGQKINPQGEIEVFLENYASYAFAIRAGIDSKGESGKELFLLQGVQIAKELMIKPLRKNANRVVKVYTKSLMKTQK